MNSKALGDIGVNITIGILAEYGIGVAFPLSDNYPFDLVLIVNNKLFKAQVKTGRYIDSKKSISFKFEKTDFTTGKSQKYSKDDCDIILGYDIVRKKLFIFSSDQFINKISFTVRYEVSLNKWNKANMVTDYEISKERILSVLGFACPELKIDNIKNNNKYNLICNMCDEGFIHTYKCTKFCSTECRIANKNGISKENFVKSYKKTYPTKEKLNILIWTKPFNHLAKYLNINPRTLRKICNKEGVKLPDKGYWNFNKNRKNLIMTSPDK